MSAPSIPNLLSLRGSRGGRGRGRGRGGLGSSAATAHDATIQGTDTDAAVSRMSAVDVGYLNDPYAKYFVSSPPGSVTRRLPIINRGTYTRTTALDMLVDKFLSESDGGSTGEKQIISLGAGTDTRCLRLFSQPRSRRVTYHEVDFPVISDNKFSTVTKQPALRTILPEPVYVEDDKSWKAQSTDESLLWCHGLDLRELAQAGDTTNLTGVRTDIPTLLISECCLCYLQTSEAEKVIKYFTDRIQDLGIILYEPVKPEDPFGKMMVSNLAARGVRMPTLDAYKEPAHQEARLRDAGFEQVLVMTVDRLWDTWISDEEKERVDMLEGLDEVEEWKLLAGHYVIAWAWRGAGFEQWAA